VDWFYALPPLKWLPREGDHVALSRGKGLKYGFLTVSNANILPRALFVKDAGRPFWIVAL
jgi:hypothetical protein